MNGKGAHRLHARTQADADDMARRWEATFGEALNSGRDRLSQELQQQMHGTPPTPPDESP